MPRTSFFAALVCLLNVVAADAQEWARKMFEVTSHDFGVVARGAEVSYRFHFRNLYKEDVHVASVRSSCGCTTTSVENDLLKSREVGSIVAVYDTRRFLGRKDATITVVFDQPFYAEVQLQVTGFIRSDIVLSPGKLDFGAVDRGSEALQRLSVSHTGRSDWQIVDIRSANEHLEAELVETMRRGSQVGYELTVRLRGDAPAGYLRDQIQVLTNDSQGQFLIDVEGNIVPEVTVSPSSLSLGVLRPGETVSKRLIVRGKKPFRILHIDCADEGFEFQYTDEAKTLHLIPVIYRAGNAPGQVRQRIHIETDLGSDVLSDLPVYGQVTDAAE